MSFVSVVGALFPLIDKLIPDKGAAATAKYSLLELEQKGELAYLEADLASRKMQTDINQEEAKSELLFKSGWRPFIGWVCGVACAWNWIGLPMFKFVIICAAFPVDTSLLSPAELTEMWPVLLAMLGISGYRTIEKIKKSN